MAGRYDLIVIGGGIGGLVLAHRAGRAGWRTLLLEREPRVGGCLATYSTPEGFWVEAGAHTLFNSYGGLVHVLEELDLLPDLLKRERLPFRMWRDGRAASIPGALNFAELALSLPRLLWTRKAGRSVEEYYGRLVGRRNYAAVFGPAFDAVICQPAGPFPASALFRRKPRRKGVPRSFTFPGGLGAMAGRIAEASPFEVMTACTAEGIASADGGYRIETSYGPFAAKRVALAVPPAAAASLMAGLQPELADALATIRSVAIESVVVVVPCAAVPLAPVAGLIGRGAQFFSVVSRDVVPDAAFRGFTFHFRPDRLDAAAKRTVIAAVLGTPDSAFHAYHEYRNVLPAFDTDHDVARLDRLLAGSPPTLAVTGNFFEGLSIGDVVARSEAAWLRLNAGDRG